MGDGKMRRKVIDWEPRNFLLEIEAEPRKSTQCYDVVVGLLLSFGFFRCFLTIMLLPAVFSYVLPNYIYKYIYMYMGISISIYVKSSFPKRGEHHSEVKWIYFKWQSRVCT